jgi:ABC-2 type transport system permease protein
MNTTSTAISRPRTGGAARARSAVGDGLTAAERLLTKLRHDPAAITMTVGAPVVLVIIFGYIFGSAISVPGGGNYREYLVPGLFVTIAANIVPSMVAVARDSTRGVVDRFRSLPITRSAIPFGQATATALYGLASFVLMALCGLAVGWRVHRGAGYALAALALLFTFQFAATWVGMYLGLIIGKEETAAQASILIFPLSMLSNVFVPTSGMPAWLRTAADWNPMSTLATAVRQLLGNPTSPAHSTWPLEHSILASVAWTALLLVIFVPLCTARYAR